MRALLVMGAAAAVLSASAAGWWSAARADSSPEQQPSSSPKSAAQGEAARAASHGKKLVLKDGSFQLVRDYERLGDRVRYMSAERGEWEELPASMIDWEATARAAEAQAKDSAALLDKVKAQERASRVDAPLDVDASLQLASGVFLPPGEGMFAFVGKQVTPLAQAGAGIRIDKKQRFKQIISPIPIVPGKRNVEIPGAKARIRLSTQTPEFYLREAPANPDQSTPILHSSRPGEMGPEIELVRAAVKGNVRRLEEITSLFGDDISRDRNVISLQRWDVAPNVFRFTLGEALPPGEYALAEMLPDGMNLFVWDFGVDAAPDGAPTPTKK